MIQTGFERILAKPDSPTADLYFANACRDWIGAEVRRLGPTVFASASALLVMRHDLRSAGGRSGRPCSRGARRGRVVLFLDDAVEEGISDPALPFLYRQKLRLVERAALRRIAPSAAAVVTSSPFLAARYGRGAGRVLDPYWSDPLAGTGHFVPLLQGGGWIEAAFLGSTVHAADLEFLWPAVCAALDAIPRLRFHLPERHRLPASLAGHPRLLRIPGGGWGAWRDGLAARRFHIALYPLLDTPFNRGRSVNKLIEHAVVGAAPVYSRSWGPGRQAAAEGAGLAVDNRPAAWLAALRHLAERPSAARDGAAGCAALARRLNRPEPQRRLWADLLGLDANAA